MKRTSSIILAGLLAGPAAFASLNFDFRTDYRSVDYNDDAGVADYSTFNVKTGRLDYQGKLSDDITFRTRIAFNKDATVTTNDAGLQKAVEFAFVTNKVADSLYLTVGRYSSEIGAFEGITSGADLYLVSAGYSGAGAAGNLGATTATRVAATSPYLYITGAKLSYKMETQEISLLAANPVVPATDQSRFMSGVVYKGGFLDKSLNLMASYHAVAAPTAAPGKDDNLTFAGLGVTYLFADNLIGVDALMNTYKHTVATVNVTDKSDTFNVTYAYKGLETITPMLKFSQTTETPDATPATKTVVTGTSVVVEYKPIKDQIMRYHLAVSSWNNKVDGAATTPAQTEILIGTRINADFLK